MIRSTSDVWNVFINGFKVYKKEKIKKNENNFLYQFICIIDYDDDEKEKDKIKIMVELNHGK